MVVSSLGSTQWSLLDLGSGLFITSVVSGELQSSLQKLVMDPLLYIFRITNGVWGVVRCRITSLLLLTAPSLMFALPLRFLTADSRLQAAVSPNEVSELKVYHLHSSHVTMTKWRILLAFFVLLPEAFWQRGSVKCPLQVPPCLMSLSDSFSANLKAVRDGGAVAHCFDHPVPVDWVHGALCYSCNR